MANTQQLGMYAPNAFGIWLTSANTPTSASLSASNLRLAWMFCAQASDTVTHLGFRYGLRTGTPPVYRISFQSIGVTDGNPTGTILGGGTPASATFTPPATTAWDGTWQWVALTNSLAITRASYYAIVIDYSSGTVNVSNFSSFSYVNDALQGRQALPYPKTFDGAAWNTPSASSSVIWGYKSATNAYGNPVIAYDAFSVTTTGNRIALKITPTTGLCSTMTLSGIRFQINSAGGVGGKTFKIGVWTSSSTLVSDTIDTDINLNPASGNRRFEYYFSSAVVMTAGTAYYIGIEAASNDTTDMYVARVTGSTELTALDGGSQCGFATYNGSVWSDDLTRRPLMELIISDISTTAAGGVMRPNMSGGLL